MITFEVDKISAGTFFVYLRGPKGVRVLIGNKGSEQEAKQYGEECAEALS